MPSMQRNLNAQPQHVRSALKQDRYWRKNRQWGTEANRAVVVAPGNGTTGFGEIYSGHPLSRIVGGDYDGYHRPAFYSSIREASTGAVVKPTAVECAFVGDQVRVLTFQGHAHAMSANTGPFACANGQQLDISVDGEAAQSVTIEATRASVKGADAAYDTSISDGDVLALIVNGLAQTIEFDGTEATQAAWMQKINDQLVGGRVVLVDTDEVQIESDIVGTGGSVSVVGASSTAEVLTALGLSGSEADDGSSHGNVANVLAVTPAEIAAIINDEASGIDGATATARSDDRVDIETDTPGEDGSISIGDCTLATVLGMSDSTTYEGGGSAVTGLTVVDVNRTTREVTLDESVRLYAGDLIQLEGSGFGTGIPEGICEENRSTYDGDLDEFVPQSFTIGRVGVGFKSKIVGYSDALYMAMCDRPMLNVLMSDGDSFDATGYTVPPRIFLDD